MSPKSTSRALSPQRTANGEDRPLSPRTAGSQNQSSRSRNPRMNPAAYPLPDSEVQTPRPPSPVERQTNKSPSIAPSDSPSQARSRRSMRSPVNDPSQPVRSVRTGTDVNGGGAYGACTATIPGKSKNELTCIPVVPGVQRDHKGRCLRVRTQASLCLHPVTTHSVPQPRLCRPRGRGAPIPKRRPRPPVLFHPWTISTQKNNVW